MWPIRFISRPVVRSQSAGWKPLTQFNMFVVYCDKASVTQLLFFFFLTLSSFCWSAFLFLLFSTVKVCFHLTQVNNTQRSVSPGATVITIPDESNLQSIIKDCLHSNKSGNHFSPAGYCCPLVVCYVLLSVPHTHMHTHIRVPTRPK